LDKFVIQGGRRLSGAVNVAPSKNATLPIICAAMLAESGKTVLTDIPDLVDIRTTVAVVNYLGGEADYNSSTRVLTIDAANVSKDDVPYDLMRRMRASFLFLGALLGRLRKARVSLPGGCAFGPRPVDLHLRGFQACGVQFEDDHGYIRCDGSKMKSSTFVFDRPTHTGTENLMIGMALTPGETLLVNAACDPEITDVAGFLNKMGAKIEGAGTSTIRITGVKRLRGTEYQPIPDRLEAGTFMIAAAMTKGTVEVRGVEPTHLEALTAKLLEMGVQVTPTRKRITVKGPARLWPTQIVTFPHPGFPTDLQPAILALLTVADGASVVTETVFPNRFSHAMEFVRMGADIRVTGNEARVAGVPRLRGTTVMAADIRAGAGLVEAALAAEGTSEILRVYHIDRGYDHLEEKLAHLGADIKRVKDE
jgi:UDP-N-acetylglucosamine 1-carboxyvinyltransferase